MTKQFNSIVLAFSLVLTLLLGTVASAQGSTSEETTETATEAQVVYYLADGDNGVDQVFRQVLDGQNNRQQLTNSDSDIVAFGVSADGLSVAYIGNGRLQLQQVDDEADASEVLAEINNQRSRVTPVFSPDGQVLAYGDQGVWLMDLATREAEQIIENIPFDDVNLNTEQARYYTPDRFVMDEAGALKLLVNIGIWEFSAAGVYDISSGTLQEIEPYVHSQLLPLSDGRVLIYGNNFIGGDATLEIATSLNNLDDPEVVLDLITLPDYAETYGALAVYEAVEMEAGTLRFFAYPLQVYPPPVNGLGAYYFEYDLESGSASEVQQVRLGDEEYNSDSNVGIVSPDGMSIAMYSDYVVNETGTEAGSMQVYDLTTSEPTDDVFLDRVSEFQWQPLMPAALQQ